MTPERWKQIEALYHAAHALPPGERAAFLAESCPDDEALRREVESLLSEADSGDGFLAGPALAMPAHTAPDMLPMIGRSLGGYQLQSLLGVGGMGEVYRARDTTLGRDVAIKILPREFTSDPNRLARFAREARMLAAVNHPGICAIYGFEEAEPSAGSGDAAIRFLILELVEGETLAAKLEGVSRRQSRPVGLPLDDALRVGRQIADALEVAHEKGIVHRDLKPANITITPDGVVKVLDFGLAKALGVEDAEHAQVGDTREGVVIGTAAYMSPEQARGLAVDKRTDIWAFGCVLYEMLTGRTAFAGDTVSDSIAKILEREPEWTLLPVGTPPSINRLLLRCLAKDPKQRLRDIADVRIEIDASNEDLPGDLRPVQRRMRTAWLPWITTAVLAIGIAGLLASRLSPVAIPSVTKFTIALPDGLALNGSRGAHIVSISPDGTNIVYSGTPHGLYLRSLSLPDTDIKLIPGTELFEASEPTFSPDGRHIAFFNIADDKLMRIPLTGGAAQTLCDMKAPPSGIRWETDGIVFGRGRKAYSLVTSRTLTDGVMLVPDRGGTPQALVQVTEGESAHGPQILPGGTHVLFTLARGDAMNRWDKAHIIVESRATRERTDLGEGSDARYLSSGHLIYALSGSVYAGAFDLRTMAFVGDRAQVIQGVRRAAGNFTGAAVLSVADNGTLIYVPGPVTSFGSAPMDLAVMDRAGQVKPLNLQPPGLYATPRVSPDDTRVAFESDDGKEAAVFLVELSGTNQMQPLTTGSNNRFPLWAPDNHHVAFQSDRGGDLGVWWQVLEGAAERLTKKAEPGTSHAPESWFGDTLLYSVTSNAGVSLRTLSLRDRRDEPVDAEHSWAPMEATISHDGAWLAYTSTKGSKVKLYVQGFPRGPRFPLAAPASDTPKHPRWMSGRELCYDPNAGNFACVRITATDGRVSFGVTPELVEKNLQMSPPYTRNPYDVTRDGRFVGLMRTGNVRGSQMIHVVLNWLEELKALAPRR